MKLSRNKIAKLLKNGNQSRKNINKRKARGRSKTDVVKPYMLNEDEIETLKKKIAIKKEIQSHKNNRIDPGMLEDYL